MKVIQICVPKVRRTAAPDGLMRADVLIPIESEILHLGAIDEKRNIGLVVLCTPKTDPKTNQIRPFTQDEFYSMELLLAPNGAIIPDGYKYRASVLSPHGVVLVFVKTNEDRGRILTLGGRA